MAVISDIPDNDPTTDIADLSRRLSSLCLQRNQLDQRHEALDSAIANVSNHLQTAWSVQPNRPFAPGSRVRILNPKRHQPTFGTVIGFTKGSNPFVRIRGDNDTIVLRLPKNLAPCASSEASSWDH